MDKISRITSTNILALTADEAEKLINLWNSFDCEMCECNSNLQKPFPMNLANSLIEMMDRILYDNCQEGWLQFGDYHFLRKGNLFDIIETRDLANDCGYIGALYRIEMEPQADMQDYIALAVDSGIEFPSDLYRYAYGLALTKQYDKDALLVKIFPKNAERDGIIEKWINTIKLIDND